MQSEPSQSQTGSDILKYVVEKLPPAPTNTSKHGTKALLAKARTNVIEAAACVQAYHTDLEAIEKKIFVSDSARYLIYSKLRSLTTLT